MNVVCIGGGPAACYFSIYLKLCLPDVQIKIVEQYERSFKTGWGLILPNQLLAKMKLLDPISHHHVDGIREQWSDIELIVKDTKMRLPNTGACSVDRHTLINILSDRALELGVVLNRPTKVTALTNIADADLVVWADGVDSLGREQLSLPLNIKKIQSKNHFIWLATKTDIKAMTFIFEQTEFGAIWAHVYPFGNNMATFVVECSAKVYEKLFNDKGYDEAEPDTHLKKLQSIFSRTIPGLVLLALKGTQQWRVFTQIYTNKVFSKNQVLLGDAAHTAHFSIGSGTKLAIDDAIALVDAIGKQGSLPQALSAYDSTRKQEVNSVQQAALNSMAWFEQIDSKLKLDADGFVRSFMRRGVVGV